MCDKSRGFGAKIACIFETGNPVEAILSLGFVVQQDNDSYSKDKLLYKR